MPHRTRTSGAHRGAGKWSTTLWRRRGGADAIGAPPRVPVDSGRPPDVGHPRTIGGLRARPRPRGGARRPRRLGPVNCSTDGGAIGGCLPDRLPQVRPPLQGCRGRRPCVALDPVPALDGRPDPRTGRAQQPGTSAVMASPRVDLWGRGVDSDQFHPARRDDEIRDRLGGGDEVVIGYVGRLAPEKNVGLLRTLRSIPGSRLGGDR